MKEQIRNIHICVNEKYLGDMKMTATRAFTQRSAFKSSEPYKKPRVVIGLELPYSTDKDRRVPVLAGDQLDPGSVRNAPQGNKAEHIPHIPHTFSPSLTDRRMDGRTSKSV